MPEFWWVTPVITSFVVTTFYVLNRHDRLRIWKLLRSAGTGMKNAVLDVLDTLGWVKAVLKPPTLADLINDRKKLRFMEFAEWDADFKRLLPPESPMEFHRVRGHNPDCRGMVEVEAVEEVRGDHQFTVRRIYSGYCPVCKWSGYIREDQAKGTVDEVGVDQAKAEMYRKQLMMERARNKRYQQGMSYPYGYERFKEEVRELGFSPDPQTLATLQRQAKGRRHVPRAL